MLTFLSGHRPNPLGAGLLADWVDSAAAMSWPVVGAAAAVACLEKAERFAALIYSLSTGQGQQRRTRITVKNRGGFVEPHSGGF